MSVDGYDRGNEAYENLRIHEKACNERYREFTDKISDLELQITTLKERQSFFGAELSRLTGKIETLVSKIEATGKKQMIMWAVLVASALGSPHLADFLKMFI